MQNSTFDFETEYRKHLDRIYAEKGWVVSERIRGKQNRIVEIIINDLSYEEKGLTYDSCISYEILQATELLLKTEIKGDYAIVPVNAIGNQFTSKAVRQIWICYQGGSPRRVYDVHKHDLDAYVLEKQFLKERSRLGWVPSGYGDTIHAQTAWQTLCECGIATIVWGPPFAEQNGFDFDKDTGGDFIPKHIGSFNA